ncbi:MAG: hypothetical protein RBS38_04990 [Bacteroidales bacterium]|jgi:hypothetical protein|nr:hypothetical protein [Bacteroidales bacterium]
MNRTGIRFFADSFGVILLFLLSSCNQPVGNDFSNILREAKIYPPYQGTVIPYNIAPLNFMIREEGVRFVVRFTVAGKDSFDVSCKGKVSIPLRKWEKLLNKHRGEQLEVSIIARQTTGWTRYRPLRFTIAAEPVDPYLVYRLIEPGYEGWGSMGIYQRCVENFDETPVILNSLTDGNCMNCHSFCRGNPQMMLFHMRQQNAGTLFVKDGVVRKINTKAPEMISAGVYPRWHPDGRYVAFSVNTTRQEFHTFHTNKVEVYDMASDLVVFDTETNTVFTDSLMCSENSFETFPEWSPDGKYLYFCSAPARPMPDEYESLRYDLLRISFDISTRRFGNRVDTLVSSTRSKKSVALPRVSPDNKYIVFCMSNFGTFPIWHRENDLYLMNLETAKITNLTTINSNQSDSYHSWSANGRWLAFGSRRMDGTYTRPYICYFDTEGHAYTPFLLPQKIPEHYDFLTKSYNIPEFITGKVSVSPNEFTKAAKGKTVEVVFNSH